MHYCSIGVVQFALLQNNVNFSTNAKYFRPFLSLPSFGYW